MLNFGASKPRVRGGARAPGAPPWIRTWVMKHANEGIKPDFKPMQMSPEVQNSGISGPMKKDDSHPKI